MEPQCPSVANCAEYSNNSALQWILHHKQSQEHENVDDFGVGRDKFLEDQWSPNMKDWTDFNKQAQVMDQNLVQSCDSPLTSDSSSSFSTWESSFFSWNSENSYTAGRHALQSPELLSSRFLGFSLFNSGINHMGAISKEVNSNGNVLIRDEQHEQFHLQKRDLPHELVELKQCTFDASIESSRPLDSEFHTDGLCKEGIDDGWVSDSGDSQSWMSTSPQELTKKDPLQRANDMHLGRPHNERESLFSIGSMQVGFRNSISTGFLGTNHNHNTLEVCRSGSRAYSYKETISSVCDICGCDSRYLGSEDINAVALTHSDFMSLEKLCCAAPHKPCKLIFAPETYQMHLIQDFESVAHNSEIEIVNEQHVSDELFKGHGLHGHYELPEHEENEHKPTKSSQYDPARVDKVKLQLDFKHLLPTSADTVVPTSFQSGDTTRPLSHSKSRHSAAVKERFASSTLHGYLRFAEQNGSPCYSFFVDDSDEVLFARVCRQEKQSNKENCDWTYSFHSKKDNGKAKTAWKGWPKKETLASDLVANMKVPGVCKAKKNQDGHAKEAHFVLYNGRGQQHVESSATENLQCQQLKPVFNSIAASQMGYTQSRGKRCSNNTLNDCASNNTLKNGSCPLGNGKNSAGSTDTCAERIDTCINRQAELAAIVISTSLKEKKMTRRKESKPPLTDSAGWGVKFLDKGSGSGWGLSFMEKSFSSSSGVGEMNACTVPKRGQLECIGAQTSAGACQGSVPQLPNDKDSHSRTCPDLAQRPEKRSGNRKNRLKVDVTVILPAGDHGWPTEDEDDVSRGACLHGPTPLLERWVSGGECECGGWDMGCGLSVFKAETLSFHKRRANIALTRHDRVNWLSPGNPFKVFTQGYKQKKVLVLEIIEAGLFSLSFQAQFSPLQAFATAVALFHQQMTHK